jgi:hypothetical protein
MESHWPELGRTRKARPKPAMQRCFDGTGCSRLRHLSSEADPLEPLDLETWSRHLMLWALGLVYARFSTKWLAIGPDLARRLLPALPERLPYLT